MKKKILLSLTAFAMMASVGFLPVGAQAACNKGNVNLNSGNLCTVIAKQAGSCGTKVCGKNANNAKVKACVKGSKACSKKVKVCNKKTKVSCKKTKACKNKVKTCSNKKSSCNKK